MMRGESPPSEHIRTIRKSFIDQYTVNKDVIYQFQICNGCY